MPETIDCRNCHSAVDWYRDRCSVCGQDVGFPNVREASSDKEQRELQLRYQKAMEEAKTRNAQQRVEAFEAVVRSKSYIVINVWPSFLAELLNSDRLQYVSYTLQVSAGTRKPASMKDDRQRRGTEGILFGVYAHEICYGALALDGPGLTSYGSCCITISDLAAKARATLLEENSYTFIRGHSILPGDDIPLGHRAVWQDRHKLAVAKLASQISEDTQESLFPTLLLCSNGDRGDDKFMEVHLYGGFDRRAVEALQVPRPDTADYYERPNVERIRDWAHRNHKGCIER